MDTIPVECGFVGFGLVDLDHYCLLRASTEEGILRLVT